jgi:hypothetical protein
MDNWMFGVVLGGIAAAIWPFTLLWIAQGSNHRMTLGVERDYKEEEYRERIDKENREQNRRLAELERQLEIAS